jgi:hypothetical protein
VSCQTCGDKGIAELNWADAPSDYAVCLCEAGMRMRSMRNENRKVHPLWRVWCAREQVDPSRVRMVEDVLTPEELQERGLSVAAARDREAALFAAGRKKR